MLKSLSGTLPLILAQFKQPLKRLYVSTRAEVPENWDGECLIPGQNYAAAGGELVAWLHYFYIITIINVVNVIILFLFFN